MKNTLIIVLLFIVSSSSFSKDYRAKLLEYSSFDHFAVSLSEDLFFGISEGNLYKSKGFEALWHSVSIPQAPKSTDRMGNFKKVYFVTNDIVIVFSYEHLKNRNIYCLYKSTNRGETWKKTELGDWNWINDVFIDNQKRIWVSALASDLYCSTDQGDTWRHIQYPTDFDGERVSISTSTDGKTFFLAGDEQTIYKTSDRFSDFTSISSPIVAAKKNSVRPVIQFEQLGSYYLARQEDKVFYTNIDNISWTQIPNAIHFVLCNQSKAYILNEDYSISLLNSSMQIEWTSDTKLKYRSELYSRNGNLYTISRKDLYKINRNQFKLQPLYTYEHPIEPTHLKINYKGQNICFDDGDVLLYDEQKEQWYREMVLPIDFGYATVFNGQILLTDYELKHYYTFDLEKNKYSNFTLPDIFMDLSAKKIKSFKIAKGSDGCFHAQKEEENYLNKDGEFIKQPIKNDTSEWKIPKSLGLKDKKDIKLIQSLLDEINETKARTISISDLQIRDKDVEAYKTYIRTKKEQFIESLKEVENESDTIDFSLLISDEVIVESDGGNEDYYLYIPENVDVYEKYETLIDTIWTMSDTEITKIFGTSFGVMSTTTDWIKLTVNFDDNTSISVYTDDTYPNYQHSPWEVDYEGLKVNINSLKIGALLNEIGEGKMMYPIMSDKRYAIHQLVSSLYDKKQKDGTLADLVYSPTQTPKPTTNYRGTIVALSLFVVLLLSLIYFVRGRNK